MAFLRLDNSDIAATKKITISLWFRVPSATLIAAKAAWQELYDAWNNDETGTVKYPPADSGIIPLVTFGKRDVEMHELDYWNHPTDDPYLHAVEIGHGYGYGTYHWDCTSCSWTRPDDTFGGSPVVDARHDNPFFAGDYTDKSFIGINVRGDSPVFDFRVQFDWGDGPPTITGVQQQTGWEQSPAIIPSYHYLDTSPTCAPPSTCGGPSNLGTLIISGTTFYWEGHQFDYLITQTWGERPYINYAERPEAFSGFPNGSIDGGQTISGDHWHHVLFSIDMDHEVATHGTQRLGGFGGAGPFAGEVPSAARCWIALDDANKTGTELSRSTHATPSGAGVQPLGDGLNDLVTEQGWIIFQDFTDTNYTTSNTTPLSGGGVRNDTFVGRTRPTYDWTPPSFALSPIGIPGDTDTVKVVELAELQVFTDVVVDTSDLAIRRLFVTADGAPADMEAAAETLGAVPVVRLIGLRNWQTGLNTGTAGNFERTGTISKFTPGPQLGT